MGISHEAYDEVVGIVGRVPTLDELSTLLAMWESNGRQQSLYAWLKGQDHAVQRDEYLYSGAASNKSVREPRIKECVDIAHELCKTMDSIGGKGTLDTGMLLYMVGNVSSEFADSEYARRCLHLVDQPMASGGSDDDRFYIELILDALADSGTVSHRAPVGSGGLFCSLLGMVAPRGYDILTPREVRLDAFLFGEEAGRYLVVIDEECHDTFLLKMDEARLNCCFLGRVTKNRIVVDGYDFGATASYANIF